MPTPADWNEVLAAHLRPGDTFRLKVNGGSMRPLLQPDDWITAQAGPADEFCVGDVLVFQRAGQFVTHRLVGHSAGQLLLKGDALRDFDPPVPPQAVLGRVMALEHHGQMRSLAERRWTDRAAALWSRLTGQLYRILFFWRIRA